MKKNDKDKAAMLDVDRREFLERIVSTTIFTVPLVLGLDVITSQSAIAQPASSSGAASEGASSEGAASGGVSSSSSASNGGSGSGSSTEGSSSEGSASEGAASGASSSGALSQGAYHSIPTGGPTSVPEPSTLALLGLGIAGLALSARKARPREDTANSDDS